MKNIYPYNGTGKYKAEYSFYPFCEGKDYKIIKVEGNKIVIEMKTTYLRAPYNGYVVFPTKDIPEDWRGDYSAGALQYLDIHGGITFCECCINDIEKNKEYIEKTKKKLEVVKEKGKDYKDFMDKFKKQQKIRLKMNQETAKLDNSYVVFGFDCAHSGDEERIVLHNSDHVMNLVRRMEQQLVDYAKIYEEWKKMNRENQVKTIEKIRGEVDTNELGFGAMIDMLAGGKVFKKEDKK